MPKTARVILFDARERRQRAATAADRRSPRTMRFYIVAVESEKASLALGYRSGLGPMR